jgi:glycosyltransferase involved in cell wall biosynthesis
MDGLVSTIVPVHNRSDLLSEAVASVIGQTYRPIEIVIVDDGSTDQTPLVADDLGSRYSKEIRVLHQPRRGAGSAREAGRRVAGGEYIQYLDSDDLLLPRKFERQIAALRQQPECGVAYGQTRYYERGSVPGQAAWKRTGERIESMFPSFLQSRWWGTSTPLYRRIVTDAAGPWLGLLNEEDWEYDCRIAAMGTRLAYVPEFVSEEREHSGDRLSRGGSNSARKLEDRATAHMLILEHGRRAGISANNPEMQHFARELFLLARQCGAAGLGPQSRDLFTRAQSASQARLARGLDFRVYSLAARILGWPLAGRLAQAIDRCRR